jgi:polysaccharide pyruvyl transferase WcaK-like protein
MSKAQRIALMFSWGQTNIGDAAITPGALVHLKRHFPDAKITIFSCGTDRSERYITSKQYLRTMTDHEILPNKLNELITQDELGIAYSVGRFDVESGRILRMLYQISPETVEAFLSSDLIYYNSGMTLMYNNRGLPGATKRLLVNWMPVMFAERLGTPCVLWGQSLGDLDWPGTDLARKYLPSCVAITTRETQTLGYLQQRLAIQGPHMAFAPDATIYFDRRDDAWAESFLSAHNLRHGEYLVAIIRTYGWWGKQLAGQRLDNHMDKIAGALDHWVKETGLPVVIAPECLREIPRAKELLYPRLTEQTKEKAILMEEFWTPDQARSLYTHARVMFSMELHSIILALPEGIPVVHPHFAEMGAKTTMVRDAGFGEYLFDIDSASAKQMGEAIVAVHENRDALSERAYAAAKQFQGAGDRQFDLIKELL